MRKYLTEIENLTKEITLLEEDRNKLFEERIQLRKWFVSLGGYEITLGESDGTVILNNKMFVSEEVLEELLATNRRYKEITESRDRLTELIYNKERQKTKLKEEWRNLHTRSYYNHMDEIDICNLISKDEYIIGIKL